MLFSLKSRSEFHGVGLLLQVNLTTKLTDLLNKPLSKLLIVDRFCIYL